MSQQIWQELNKKHRSFTFTKFETKPVAKDFQISFHYALENGPNFIHQVVFSNFDFTRWQSQPADLQNQLLFHLGLVEMLSYWKTTACSQINISATPLSNQQLPFWQDLLRGGLGEFLFVNHLEPKVLEPNWRIETTETSAPNSAVSQLKPMSSLVGIGGGKDSLVTTYLLNKNQQSFSSLIIEPASPATLDVAKFFPSHHIHKVKRIFDPQLFELNKHNYLNGHVPFSASATFIGLISAVAEGHQNFIVSNENSASEESVCYHNLHINHQFSKSFSFEKSLDQYCKQFLLNNVNYFSFIRPFYELKIAQIFCSLPEKFLTLFRSCNRAQQRGEWCENCPKCLFVFLMMSPFCNFEFLTTSIFSTNLFADDSLIEEAKKLTGLTISKPLECVGTIEESKVAFYLTIKKLKQEKVALTPMLELIEKEIISKETHWDERTHKILSEFTPENLLPNWAEKIAKTLI